MTAVITLRRQNEPHGVYRLFDTRDQLLYVGCSVDPAGRLRHHRTRKPWRDRIDRMTIEWHPDRSAGLQAEAAAIEAELPAFNIQRHPINRGATIEVLCGPLPDRIANALAEHPLVLAGVERAVRMEGDPRVAATLKRMVVAGWVVARTEPPFRDTIYQLVEVVR